MTHSETELIYGQSEGRQLRATYYQPDDLSPASSPNQNAEPFLIDVHGGAWSSGHRKNGRLYCRAMADQGFSILAIDLSDGRVAKHPAASADISAAVRYTKLNLLQNASQSIALIGSSSGGHLALYTGLLPNHEQHRGTKIHTDSGFHAMPNIDAGVNAVVALWPVSNPLARYQYVTARAKDPIESWGPNFTPDQLMLGHQAYFTDDAAMSEATIQNVLSEGRFESLPNIFIVQPALDLNVPAFMSQTLLGACQRAGANVAYKCYAGVAHGFAQLEGPKTEECIADIIGFLRQIDKRQ